jgi:anti-sigma factor RsiW
MSDDNSPVTEDELHAFVDGELPADRRGAVEAWLASHPDDAARVSSWRKQAELIHARYGGVTEEPVPERLTLERLARGNRNWMRIAAGIVLIAFLAGGTAGWFARGVIDARGRVAPRTVWADALDAHKIYVVEVRHPIEVAANQTHLIPWLSKRLDHQLRAPDLASFGLKLLGGRLLVASSGAPAALFMYEGPSGERYTIYCARSTAPETALRYNAAGQVAAVYWIERQLAYVVSGPADHERLVKVAQTAYEQIDRSQPNRNSWRDSDARESVASVTPAAD